MGACALYLHPHIPHENKFLHPQVKASGNDRRCYRPPWSSGKGRLKNSEFRSKANQVRSNAAQLQCNPPISQNSDPRRSIFPKPVVARKMRMVQCGTLTRTVPAIGLEALTKGQFRSRRT
jgi:hypothetical protein